MPWPAGSRLTRARRARTRHGRAQAEVVVDLRHRRQAVHRDARSHEVGVGRGVDEGRGAVGQVAHLGAAAGPLGDARRPRRSAPAGRARSGARARRRGRSACQMPTTRTTPSASRGRAWRTRSSQAAPKAPPRPSPVSTLRWTRAVRPCCARGGGDLVERPTAPTPTGRCRGARRRRSRLPGHATARSAAAS